MMSGGVKILREQVHCRYVLKTQVVLEGGSPSHEVGALVLRHFDLGQL